MLLSPEKFSLEASQSQISPHFTRYYNYTHNKYQQVRLLVKTTGWP